ncbi:major cell surface glycoprotein [Halobacterium salinarum]|uniref:HVO_2072 family ArtA-dependent S-layer glycoprotein n=1 Tax=Halobacterium salinarum TaxID=2242 RepID=UPI001F2F60FA|nr:HVO_2072 family ArtA-dependent S-layer glycoprotein [Halobacterium salinarum]MCF2206124.1 major cell surface glycoprotein [Halobacterium salinarum]MCF2239871.1 major cell surface glycoprotein [Halobacterium salinarum]
MTDTTSKLRAVLLTALMVGSVIGAGVAFTGGAAAANADQLLDSNDRYNQDAGFGAEEYKTSNSIGSVGDGATLFQGEEDVTFYNASEEEDYNAVQLSRTGGSDEGLPLQMPLPEDQATGSYDANGPDSGKNGFAVTVQSPSVTMLEVRNNADNDVTGGVLNTQQDESRVAVDYNYYAAEDIELTVEDEDGLDVTDEILTGSSDTRNNGTDTAYFDINPNNVDAGDYTFSVEGVEDLDFGDATESVSVTISSSNKASLNLAEDEVVQGSNLKYTIENSPEGNYHAVTIDSGDFRDNNDVEDARKIMRSVGDTVDSGVVTGDDIEQNDTLDANETDYAYAIVEIDDGNGVGSIETQYLDDSSVDIDLYPASGTDGVDYVENEELDNVTALNDLSTDDDTDFDVTQGDITLDNPTGAYVVGSEVDINGTANEGTDDVVLYARDNNEFELVTIDGEESIEVDSDDTFEEEDITLSDGSDILGLPGTYRLGIIDERDAVDSDGNVREKIDTSDFNQGVSSTSSIRVTETDLTASFETYNGQIADDDNQIDVEGTAPGKNNVAAIFVGSRGEVEFKSVSVDSDGTFDEEDISLDQLNQGTASAHILSSGRDDTFGEDTASSIDELEDVITDEQDGYVAGSPTGNQIRDRILANTVDDTASDDLIVTQEFRLVDGLTTIESTEGGEAGGTLTVMGTTNRKADDNTITVELLQGDTSVEINSTEEWNNNGQWSVDVPLSNVEPGNYTVEADDGDNTDRQNVEIVEELEEPDQTTVQDDNQTTTTMTTTEPTETTTEMTTTQEETTENGSEGTSDGESGGSIPGFGVGVALVAVLGAALLALRQN